MAPFFNRTFEVINIMSHGFTLEEIVFNTIHHNNKGVPPAEIAANTGTGYNHLTRMANMTDTCRMPVNKLVPVMNTTEDYSILDYLAKQTNHLVIKMPRGIRKGTDPRMDISTYNREFADLVDKLVDFVSDPSDKKMAEVDEAMRKHIGDSVNIHRRCKKHNMHQRELDL